MERVGLDSTHSRVIAAIALVGFALIGAIWVAMPLIVAVGTSKAEALASFHARERVEYIEAAIASAVLLLCIAGIIIAFLRQRRFVDALERSETQFRMTFNQAAVGMAHTSVDGRFLRVNRKLCEMLGYPEPGLLQRTLVEITHPDDVAETRLQMEQGAEAGAGPLVQEREKRYLHKDGSTVWVAIAVSLVRDELGRPLYYVTVFDDITARKRAEALSRLEHSVAQLLAGTDDVATTLKAIMRVICESEGWALGRYWRVDEAAGVLRPMDSWSVPDATIERFLETTQWSALPHGTGWVGRVWQSGEAEWVADVSKDARLVQRSLVHETGMRGVFAFPIVSDGAAIGVLSFASREIREPDEGLLATARSIGSQLGQFLARREGEAVLRTSEERFRSLAELSSDWYWEQDDQFRFTMLSGEVIQKGNFRIDSALGKTRWELPIELSDDEWAAHKALLEAHLPFTDFEYGILDADGKMRSYSARGKPLFNASGRFLGYRGTANDITKRKQGEETLRRFRAAMDATSDAIYLTDRASMRFLDVNEAACRMQSATREELLARGPDGVLTQSVEELARTYDSIIAGGPGTEPLELLRTRKDGTQVWVELQRRAQHSDGGWMIITVVRDITERKKLEERLLHQANFDNLTQLPNRALCYDRLQQAIFRAKRKTLTAALLFIDLDRFKEVNDTFGHGAGDELLKQVSQRLIQCVRAGDTVGRLGGDEFVIVLPEVAEAKDAGLIARKAIEALARPFRLEEEEVCISASIGIATCPDHGDEVAVLIKNADAAMFCAKQAGRNSFRFHTPETALASAI